MSESKKIEFDFGNSTTNQPWGSGWPAKEQLPKCDLHGKENCEWCKGCGEGDFYGFKCKKHGKTNCAFCFSGGFGSSTPVCQNCNGNGCFYCTPAKNPTYKCTKHGINCCVICGFVVTPKRDKSEKEKIDDRIMELLKDPESFLSKAVKKE